MYPATTENLLAWTWDEIEPHYQSLLDFDLTQDSFETWLQEWDKLARLLSEMESRIGVQLNQNVSDSVAEANYERFYTEVDPQRQAYDQKVQTKLVDSHIDVPAWFELAMRDIQTRVDLFREENIPLATEVSALTSRYDKITGSQTAEWDGEEVPLMQLMQYMVESDRTIRQEAWVKTVQTIHADSVELNDIWQQLYALRQKIATNADLSNFRDYRWLEMGRFDYTPEDCKEFYAAVEKVILPLKIKLDEKRRQRLDVDELRPWDMMVDPDNLPPLKPYETVEELESQVSHIFHQIHPQLGSYIDIMRDQDLLDQANRANKAPAIYCTQYYHTGVPFIFGNAVGLHEDVNSFIHEAGHAFHTFEMLDNLNYIQQMNIPMEIAEVASQTLELLTLPYLHQERGGFYDDAELNRVAVQTLERVVSLWVGIAKFGIFQDKLYEDPQLAQNPEAMHALNLELAQRFNPLVNYSGYEELVSTQWQDVLHFYHVPFYLIDYALAFVGAVQIWMRSQTEPQQAMDDYLAMLGLGNTRPLPELYATAGAKLAFDESSLGEVTAFLEQQFQHYGAL